MPTTISRTYFAAILLVLPCFAETLLFEDDFSGKLGDGWSWVRENPAAWRVDEGALMIRVEPGNMWGTSNDARNVLTRPVPTVKQGGVRASVHMQHTPTHLYEQVDLVWYFDDSNMVKIGVELVHGQLSLVMGREANDRADTLCIIPLTENAAEVRFTAHGDKLRGEYRIPNDAAWKFAGACTLPVKGEAKISLQAYQGPDNAEHWARLSQFRITQVEAK